MRSKDFLSLEQVIAELQARDFRWDRFDQKYLDYMNSWEWHDKRRKVLERAQFHCERCGRPHFRGFELEVHHKTYKHLGNEPLEDLEALCERCHDKADKERKLPNVE